jgi:hypothetical protein
MSYAIARTGNFITGNSYTDFFENFNKPLWQILQHPNVLICEQVGHSASAHPMAMTLAAISNSWESSSNINTTPASILACGDYDNGGFGLLPCEYFDNHYGWDVFYGALWDVINGGPGYICDFCKAQQILNSAPWDGPFYHDANDNALISGNFGWCATRRFFDDNPRQNVGKAGFNGNFNGLDYMLLFNLYYLDMQKQTNTSYVPLHIPQVSNPFISDHYPYYFVTSYCPNGCPIGTISDQAQIFSPTFPVIANQLSVTANSGPVPGIGDLLIFGGVQGVLLTNTLVENGAHLEITNTSVNCVPLLSYYFDPTSYHLRSGTFNSENSSSQLPFYYVSEEFKLKEHVNTLSVYPSPANDNIFVEYCLIEDGSLSILVQDMFGKNVAVVIDHSSQLKGTYKTTIQTSDLPNGMYNCIMKSNDAIPVVKKIIISH